MAENDALIEFKNVNLQFGDVWALKNISLTLNAGETRIILGAAGSGKTMLLKSVIGLVPVDTGEICLFGQAVTSMAERDLYRLRSGTGMLFQEGGLFDSLTIGENVEYPLVNRQTKGKNDDANDRQDSDERSYEQRVRDSLRFVELEATFDKFPSELSGGMRRRVGIARATVTEPPLLLYDSPTAGLDPITANTIMALVAKEREVRHTASLIVTHRYQDGEIMSDFRYDTESEELIRIAEDDTERHARTKFIVMKEGEIVFFGTRQELERSDDSYVKRFVRREETHAQ